MPTYTIKAVNPQVREYNTKFGPMKAYKLLLEDVVPPVDLSQKADTPAPTVGQTLEGTIDMSGAYGPKFKKEYASGNFPKGSSGGSTASSAGTTSGRGKFDNDPFTMYLSYAKDLVVALQETAGYDDAKYKQLLKATIAGGKALYEARPGATPATPPAEATAPTDNVEEVVGKQIDAFLGGSTPLTGEEDPWQAS
jgi:hypothetical protein